MINWRQIENIREFSSLRIVWSVLRMRIPGCNIVTRYNSIWLSLFIAAKFCNWLSQPSLMAEWEKMNRTGASKESRRSCP